jgi:autotransporter-associated beta strand protein
MKIRRLVLLAVGIALCGGATAQAQWGPNGLGAVAGTDAYSANGIRDYDTAGNWNNSTLNNSFTGTTLTGDLRLYLDTTTLSNSGLSFNYGGDFNLTLQNSAGTGTRGLPLSGNVSFNPTGAAGRTLTFDRIAASFNGVDRTFDIGTGHTMVYTGAAVAAGTGRTLTKTGGGIFELGAGSGNVWNLQLNEGEFRFGLANRLGGSATIESSGTLNLNGFSQTAVPLILNGGALTGGAATFATTAAGLTSTGGGNVTFTGAGGLTLGGGVTYNSGAANKTLTFTGGGLALGASRTFTVADGGQAIDVDVGAVVSGSTFGVTKAGAGVMRMSGVNTYTGATAVNAGILQVTGSGSINTSSGITVGAGGSLFYSSSVALTNAPTLSGTVGNRAKLGGTGTINAAVALDNLNDVLSPGNSPGTLNFGTSQTWQSYTYEWEVNNWTGTTAGTDFDQIAITGALSLSGTGSSYVLDLLSLTSENVAGSVPNFSETNRSWKILTTSGGITGFDASEWSVNAAGFTNPNTGLWSVSQVGNDLELSYVVIVPEPSAVLLGGFGLVVTGWVVRRQQRGLGRR